jgi:radical SAM superfamily enzyme YgiQ (UPF0313 family)
MHTGWDATMADIVLINPKFEISFSGSEHAMALLGKRAFMPVAALPLLASLTPPEHRVTLVDENVEPIDFDRCSRADIVGITGMVVQRHRMREIITELKRRGVFVIVGGSWITVKEDYFGDVVDSVFVGEAEETWPRFLADWQDGKPQKRYEQADKTDMSLVPVPRFDLLKMNRYFFASLQFSRGCPFLCEFCDIIVMFGRRPRLKSAKQVIAELEQLRAYKLFGVFIVDDNLIGNKKAIKEILVEVIAWQRKNGYPLVFTTEASIDLADDDELMRLMVDANVLVVFVGIESPNEASLRETRKLQNVRRGGSLVEKVRRIQNAGMEVHAGMIVGFDNDDGSIFEAHRKFLESARIDVASVGMLSAIPSTPLYARLMKENRLNLSDVPAYGTNILPLRMTPEELSGGYVRLMASLYDAKAFFSRVDDLYINGKLEICQAWLRYAADHRWLRFARHLRIWIVAFFMLGMILSRIHDRSLRSIYVRQFWRALKARRSAIVAVMYAMKCAQHYHYHRLVRTLQAGDVVNTY